MLLLNLIKNPFYFVSFVVALLIGVTIHEFAHAFIADRSGDPTPKLDGRITLNPLAHLDPLGTIFLFLAGFGWGKPVMINSRNFHHKKDELKVAIAGIAANIILALLLAIPIRVALIQGRTIESSNLLSFLNTIVDINLVLATFNILPIFPLDGSHFVEYFLGEEAKATYQQMGPYILFGLIIYGQLTGNSILFTIMEPILRILSLLVKGTFSLSI
ncbi:MAG: site-2 protease family protein [Patescibacteria group bacterium]|nr:site-2 protease family protein [Patescibacteria group bacterium]